ncbi:hypothetical protein LTR56_000935 [Elasticomyces elasticus]|nr:hypothetical protein LTR56_000935 [Elasticomyces elasticus]KAK3665509.1 hypothetical protein LTR22_003739 [Elasticomyces elasticus]KAK5759451.1 hypothetical protein LTS12_010464 [Elasticomyces elasticus]
MNGSTSPAPQPQFANSGVENGTANIADVLGSDNAAQEHTTYGNPGLLAPAAALNEQDDNEITIAPDLHHPHSNEGDDDAAGSEAETLIDSPVKKREAQILQQQQQHQKPMRSRIGGLPVPGEDDEESESVATPAQSTTERSDVKVMSSGGAQDTADEMDLGSDKENSSGSLSSAPSPASASMSVMSAQSRALSEGPEVVRSGPESPNTRKRKHRASSVGFPNKRRSMDPPKRTLRMMHSEDNAGRAGQSPSPRPRSHRRAVSTQSAVDGTVEVTEKKRKTSTHQFPVRDPRSARPGWEESDASSETTSLGQVEARRPQRGIGRSTSTPGRPAGREHKRHVNRYGFTRLAEACEANDLDLVKEWREKDPDQLEIPNHAQNKPLQIAAVNGNAEIVEYLIEQGCQIECANVDKDTPLIDAAENGYLDVVKILLQAGVDPLRQNLKGQQALDVVTDDNDEVDGIRAALRSAIDSWSNNNAKQQRDEEEEARHKAGPSKELHFMARTYENLLKLVTNNDRNGVKEFLDARVPVDNGIIAAAAKTGDQFLINMLLADMSEKKAHQKPEKPMLAVLGTSHFEMVKMLTTLDQFKPLWRNKNGKAWPDLAAERNGPNWRQEHELLQRLHDAANEAKARRSSSPVTKREHIKRRLPQQVGDDDDSDDEDGPKPKNSRRLMSRRAMRAANGRNDNTDSDEEDSTSSTGTGLNAEIAELNCMGPPDGGKAKSTTRQRTKSMSSQAAETSPRTRRRSSSLRGPQDPPLPTVEEKMEDAAPTEHDQQVERAKFVLLQAQALETQRRDAELADAEVKRMEIQKAEEGRKAEADRKEAENSRIQMEEERTRQMEKAQKEEVERRRKEAEMEGARGEFRRGVLALLPDPIARSLDPESSFRYAGHDAKASLLEHCTPLLVTQLGEDGRAWVLNVQAASLLGKRGLELLLPLDHELGFERTFSKGWQAQMAPDESSARHVIHQLATLASSDAAHHSRYMNGPTTFETEVRLESERMHAIEGIKHRLGSGALNLEWVPLDDILANIDPLFAGTHIVVHHIRPPRLSKQTRDLIDASRSDSFIDRMQTFWTHAPSTETYMNGRRLHPAPIVGTTQVMMVHEK